MISKKVEKLLIEQISKEAYASNLYLDMACWCDRNGFHGMAKFLFKQAEEEREHMMKIIHFLLDTGSYAQAPSLPPLSSDYKSVPEIFQNILKYEKKVTATIYQIVDTAQSEKDHASFHFLQWFVQEQIEEENQFNAILDKLRLAGTDSPGLYLLDKELGSMAG